MAKSPANRANYAAFIADVAGSRKLTDRAGLQRRLRQLLDQLSAEHQGALTGRLVLLRGDEIQGLLSRPSAVVGLLSTLATEIFPHRLHCGVGYGPVTTDLLPDPAQMDGPCFYSARAALDRAERTDSWMVAEGFGSPQDQTLTTIFALMHAIRGSWTGRQNEIAHLARTAQQKEVASKLGVSPSVVSESLKASSFRAIRDGEETAAQILATFDRE